MKCKDCNTEMKGVTGYDDPQRTDYAYNLNCCEHCGMVAIENVWENPGVMWVPASAPFGLVFVARGAVHEVKIEGTFTAENKK